MTAHVRRHHRHDHSSGHGHIRQGRFNAFSIQEGEHLLTVLRYIERNLLRDGASASLRAWFKTGRIRVVRVQDS
jgi:putative transposase